MNYQYTYINKQIEPNGVSYTLVLYDLTSGDEHRIPKSFKQNLELVDYEFLRQVAAAEIQRIILEKQQAEVEEVITEEVPVDGDSE